MGSIVTQEICLSTNNLKCDWRNSKVNIYAIDSLLDCLRCLLFGDSPLLRSTTIPIDTCLHLLILQLGSKPSFNSLVVCVDFYEILSCVDPSKFKRGL